MNILIYIYIYLIIYLFNYYYIILDVFNGIFSVWKMNILITVGISEL